MASLKAYINYLFARPRFVAGNKSFNVAKAWSKGFTMIEVIVVMGILVFAGGLGLIMSMDNYRGYLFRNEVTSIVGALQQARAQSISNVCKGAGCTDGKPHGVRVNAGNYVIYQCQNGATLADAYNNRDAAYDQIISAGYAPASLNGPDNDIVFEKLSGNAIKKRNIIITDNSAQAVTVTINDEGQIDWSSVTH